HPHAPASEIRAGRALFLDARPRACPLDRTSDPGAAELPPGAVQPGELRPGRARRRARGGVSLRRPRPVADPPDGPRRLHRALAKAPPERQAGDLSGRGPCPEGNRLPPPAPVRGRPESSVTSSPILETRPRPMRVKHKWRHM